MDIIKKIYKKKILYILFALTVSVIFGVLNYFSLLKDYYKNSNIPNLKQRIKFDKKLLVTLKTKYNELLPAYNKFIKHIVTKKEKAALKEVLNELFYIFSKEGILFPVPQIDSVTDSYKYLNVVNITLEAKTLKNALITEAVLPYVFNSFNANYKVKAIERNRTLLLVEIYKLVKE